MQGRRGERSEKLNPGDVRLEGGSTRKVRGCKARQGSSLSLSHSAGRAAARILLLPCAIGG